LVGSLVVSLDHRDLGIGKIASAAGSNVAVEYFDSVADPVALRIEVPADRLRQAPLQAQQRVWYRRNGVWGVGRVIEHEFRRVRVRPPGDAADFWFGVEDIHVRWDRPLEDPVAVMQARAFETPHYYFARRAFLDSMLEQDRASRGNRALTSSAIELYDHQIEVAARLLSDPVQRFLLADEVGMGKTIEAGIVIRQHLLDHPNGVVRVVAPARLCAQWRRELTERFFVDDLVEARVDVLPNFNDAAWSARGGGVPDLLVVDEAHHVARWARGSRENRARFAAAKALAHASPRLLLLSATPVAHNEATYLAMLHLLDPENHSLEHFERFRDRVERRHELAKVFALFRPRQLFRRLERNADRFRDLLEGDPESIQLLDEMLAVGSDGEQEELDRRIRALRIAVTDRHRIHHRMLRSRRDVATNFPVRGRTFAQVLDAGTPGGDDLSAWLDRWRDALAADAVESGEDRAAVVRVMFDRVLAFPDVLTGAVRVRIGMTAGTSDARMSDEERQELRAVPVGPAEREVLADRLRRDDPEVIEARVEAVVEYVWTIPRRRKVVVFATYPTTAVRLANALRERLAVNQVAVHLLGDHMDVCRHSLTQFEKERACNVLVCDQSADEGLNLQFADVLVHVELPVDPNRLEQRIGRLDRHGPDTPVENVVVGDSREGSYLDAWIAALRDGVKIFDRSVSSFQFVIDRLTPDLMTALAENGPRGITELAATVPARLEDERREIAEQDQLDAIEAVELTQTVAAALRKVDERWEEYEYAQESLICCGKGHLRFTRREHFQHRELTSYWITDPVRGGEPLIPKRDLTAYMNGALSEQESALYGSYDRGAVLRHPGTRMWAAGDPFLDGLARYVRERDDRGRVYAFWKSQSDLEDGIVLAALRLDIIVEPKLRKGDDLEGPTRAVLVRRAMTLLPPAVETVWISTDGTEVTDRTTVRRLASKYSPKFGDRSVHGDHWEAIESVLPGLNWDEWCRSARDFAKDIVRSRGGVVARIDQAEAGAERHGVARVEALRSRQRLGADADALAFEERAAQAVQAAVAAPRLVVDAMGLVLLSRELPKRGGA
jgi:ATP-dependent helicase HepA